MRTHGYLLPQKLLIIEAKQVHEEVDHEGVIELEQEAVLQNLSDFFWVLLLQLLGGAKLFQRRSERAVPNCARGHLIVIIIGCEKGGGNARLLAMLEDGLVQSATVRALAALDVGHGVGGGGRLVVKRFESQDEVAKGHMLR
jgi:hypothetical protein